MYLQSAVAARLLPALSVPAGSGKLPRDGGALAAPQTSHDGGGGQSCTPGGITLGLLNKGGGGTSHDAAGSGGRTLKEEEAGESIPTGDSFPAKMSKKASQIMKI